MKASLTDDPVWNTALDWLERVQQAPQDTALQAACAAWQAAAPEHAAAWRKAERVWRLSGGLSARHAEHWSSAPAVTSQQPTAVLPMRRIPRPRRRAWIGTAVAAALVLALLPALPHRHADYASGVGEMRLVQLSDGTRVTLGSDSALVDHFNDGQRNVELLHGEAFFDVTPDPQRPFTVTAGSGAVRVTGTAFEVRLAPERLNVAVTHGAVKVSDGRLHSDALDTALTAGDQIQLDYDAKRLQRNHLQPTQIASWRQGQLVADDQSIGELVSELRRYHRGLILLPDDALAAEKVTGVYDLRNPQAALRALVQAHGGQLRTWSDYLWVISRS
ncbi:FecR family protein [Pseudomonas vanderleydeniana]|uniref:FecR domain-containing protein n=1 Tax=Pseudomonas vanderleydeniana TaxID=2745495 RepID=A0A9E6PFU2_9PSED|nr:FecR domain-containing protein [Pseudomonas vanderleydeniana]QXI25984.1 FecR domain-containing protein [Pseudomonas vanderleydeniana]